MLELDEAFEALAQVANEPTSMAPKSLLLLALGFELTRCERDDVVFMQHRGQKVVGCDAPLEWPCDSQLLSTFPLQVINRDKKKCSTEASDIMHLNLTSGTYLPICYIPNTCLNACGISPISGLIYCEAFGFDGDNSHRQLVRVNCPYSHVESLLEFSDGSLKLSSAVPDPEEGSVCYYGQITSSFAASFDPDDGRFVFRSDSKIRAIAESDLSAFIGTPGPAAASETQVLDAEVVLRTVSGINGVADFVISSVDLNNGQGTLKYLLGCDGNKVQCVPLETGARVQLTMDGSDPSGNSGAQWAFGNQIYCAYNNGDDGVIDAR